MYCIVIFVKSTFLVLARKPNGEKAFLKEETTLPDIDIMKKGYFKEDFFIQLDNFKIELGRYFGIDIVDTDLDLEDRKHRRYEAKSPRPSVRHFTSFLLQHQNLIANKHSMFYRFDEKAKREQVIDQFKIFTGFVSQDYFTKKQRLNEFELELKNLLSRQKNIKEQQNKKNEHLSNLLKEFTAVTGTFLIKETAENIVRHPAKYLEKVQSHKIIPDYDSNEHVEEFKKLNKGRNQLVAEKRRLQHKLAEINSSIEYANQYKEVTENTATLKETTIHVSECPFCKSKSENLLLEANSLGAAVNWLNSELSKTPLLLDSFLSEQKALEEKIEDENLKLTETNRQTDKIEKSIEELKKNKPLEEQGLKLKLRVENFLEERIEVNLSDIENEIERKQSKISSLEKELHEKYNPEKKLRDAEIYINSVMKKIGSNFDFEKSYKPINLKFSLDSFDLWHEKADRSKVFLRSMGSGANWLYCHLTLFTSLHSYFCSLNNQCLIPSILFIDQPSQVYFPISIDYKEKFDAEELKKIEGKVEKLDEDLNAVANIYTQLVKFCANTLKETGIEPQIIVTDHADNLELHEVEFETLVNGRRWRNRGFIEINSELES